MIPEDQKNNTYMPIKCMLYMKIFSKRDLTQYGPFSQNIDFYKPNMRVLLTYSEHSTSV